MKYLDKNYWLHLLDVLLKRPNVANGFIDYTPQGTDEVHERGKETTYLGATKEVLQSDGDWRSYFSDGELQKRDFTETMACVSFSACNVLETLVNFYFASPNETHREIAKVFTHFGLVKDGKANFSDRYIAKLSGTTRRGNTQKNVADAIRHYGLIPETEYPWVDGWDNYYANVPQELIAKGKALLEYIDFTYEWADPAIAKDSLRYAPLQTSVFAWNGIANDIYVRTSNTRNHATVKGMYANGVFYINDSYDPFIKRLARDFMFGYDMIFTIHLKKPLAPTEFNQAKINTLRASGVEYVLLVEDYKKYTRGLWQLTDNGLIKVDDNNLPEEYKKQRNDAFIRERSEDGSLKPYKSFNFKELVNI